MNIAKKGGQWHVMENGKSLFTGTRRDCARFKKPEVKKEPVKKAPPKKAKDESAV